MFSLSNGFSLLRAPLAFFFLSESVSWRIAAIFLAMFTDFIDGFLARRNRSATQLGAILDPVMDKFFVFFALIVFMFEQRIELWQACAMISRDFSLCFFGIYLGLSGHWQAYQCKAIRWGKITTALQFLVLIGLALNFHFSSLFYTIFILFGTLAFHELYQLKKETKSAEG